ncbi:hypothetical protein GW17_00048945, partial [Ensete ventricosum]
KGAAAIKGRRVAECTVVVEVANSDVEREIAVGNLRSKGSLLAINKEDGNKRLLLTALVRLFTRLFAEASTICV